ncbi:MAG: BMP family ABC transporter substrate-binding protein [Betaproteobacteria bacterium]|jgi:simple sugar transport system substrate-binding protein|nr:MAG: BMP family ABC transporter substrate-binding protein [Betaproteobacteria bacterium]
MKPSSRLIAAAAAALLAAACGRQEPPAPKAEARKEEPKKAEPLKVGFVYVSPVGDAGWTSQHDAGRKEMEQALAGKVVTTFVEKVPEGADAERVIRDLAAQGNRLIFTTSFGFMNPTIKVAEEFPAVKFEHATGYKSAANVGTYNIRFYEGRYLAGIVAGRMTKTNTLGYVAAFPIPEVLQGINAFTLGARSVNPKMQVRVIWVNSWYDPGKERDAANTLIGQGADVLTHHTDSTAVVAAAEEKGKMAVAYHSNMAKFGPKAQIAAVSHHWGAYYTRVAQSVLDGTWKPSNIWGGMKDGMIKLEAIGPSVPKEVVDLVKAKEADIVAGKFHPFTGPIRTNTGKEVIATGHLSDEQLGKMDFYVEGVVGKVPAGGS